MKNKLRDGTLHRWVQRRKDSAILAEWELKGCPLPPPAAFKQQLIRNIGKKLGIRVLVETGTYYGHTIAASLGTFDSIQSIELFEPLYENAVRRFARHPKVKLHLGDSAEKLPDILKELRHPTLFWLDAHYSGEGTARADIDTPVIRELQTVAHHDVSNHVILIDDARCFNGSDGYPTIEVCQTLAAELWPQHEFAVENDIIRITPQAMGRITGRS